MADPAVDAYMERLRAAEEQRRERERGLALPELLSGLGALVAGRPGSHSPTFERLRAAAADDTTSALEREMGAERGARAFAREDAEASAAQAARDAENAPADELELQLAGKLAPGVDFKGAGVTRARLQRMFPSLKELSSIERERVRAENRPERPAPRDPVADHIAKREYDNAHRPRRQVEPKQFQYVAAGYADRVRDAMREMDSMDYDRTALASGGVQSYLPNALRSEGRQRQDQAERNFLNAVLRKESGAVIGASEFESGEKQYFPRTGDSPAVVEQKRRNRERTLANLEREGAPVLEQREGMSDGATETGPAPDRAAELAKKYGF